MAEFPLTRASLLLRLRNPRDEAAWSQFVELYAPWSMATRRKQGLQDADAADLSQEVLGAIAGAVGQLEYDPKRGAFRNWLFTIVRRKVSNWRAVQKHRARGSGDSVTQQLLEECPAPESEKATWETDWEDRVFAWASEQVRRAVTTVTWQAFWKTAIDGQPGKQVATDLGLSIAAVYRARSRVTARLKELVQSVHEP